MFFESMLRVIPGSLEQGLAYALVALGIVISFRILSFPDLTVDGSFALGGAVTARLIFEGVSPSLSILAAVISGFTAGCLTGLLNTRLKINSLLAGILFSLMAWFAFAKAAHSLRRGIYKGWMKLPEYPAKYLFAFGCLLTAVTFFILFFNTLASGRENARMSGRSS